MKEITQQIEDIMSQIGILDDIMEIAMAEDDLAKAKDTLAQLKELEDSLKEKIDEFELELEKQ